MRMRMKTVWMEGTYVCEPTRDVVCNSGARGRRGGRDRQEGVVHVHVAPLVRSGRGLRGVGGVSRLGVRVVRVMGVVLDTVDGVVPARGDALQLEAGEIAAGVAD